MGNGFFRFKQFVVHQERCAMKVGTDGVLLGAWAMASQSPSARILDVGTGTGVVALMMAQRFPQANVTAIEIDAESATQAHENVLASPFAGRIEVKCVALQQYEDERFDAIVCNPPFFTNALTCPDPRRTLSRHSASLTYADVVRAAGRLLRPGGTLSVIVPADSRSLAEGEAALAGLCAERVCLVSTKQGGQPKRALLAWTLGVRREPEEEHITLGDDRHRHLLEPFMP